MGTLASNIDPDEMQNNAAFHLGLHCLLILKHTSGTEIHHKSETSFCDPLNYNMFNPISIVSICMGKSIRNQSVKRIIKAHHSP